MSESNSLCGPHTEIVRTESVRITRCPCGAVHINLAKNGTSLQLTPEYFGEVAQAIGLARTVLAGKDASHQHATGGHTTRFVTISPFDPKKSSN